MHIHAHAHARACTQAAHRARDETEAKLLFRFYVTNMPTGDMRTLNELQAASTCYHLLQPATTCYHLLPPASHLPLTCYPPASHLPRTSYATAPLPQAVG